MLASNDNGNSVSFHTGEKQQYRATRTMVKKQTIITIKNIRIKQTKNKL